MIPILDTDKAKSDWGAFGVRSDSLYCAILSVRSHNQNIFIMDLLCHLADAFKIWRGGGRWNNGEEGTLEEVGYVGYLNICVKIIDDNKNLRNLCYIT